MGPPNPDGPPSIAGNTCSKCANWGSPRAAFAIGTRFSRGTVRRRKRHISPRCGAWSGVGPTPTSAEYGRIAPGLTRQSLPLIHHHTCPHVRGPQFRHLHAEALAPLRSLHTVAVWAQQLQIPDLVLPVVAQRHNVVHLEPRLCGRWKPQPVADIVSRLAGPGAAGAVHVRRQRSPPPAMPSQPQWSPPDPQRPWPYPTGTLPTTTPTVDRGWLRRHRPRAVAGVASWRRPGAPEPPPSWLLRQPTAPAAALLLGPEGGPSSPDPRRANARLPYRTADLANCARVRVCTFRSSGMLAVVIRLLRAPYAFPIGSYFRQSTRRSSTLSPLNRPTVTLPVPSARSASLAISRSAPLRRLRRTDACPPEWWRSGKPDQIRHHAIH